MAGLNWLIKMAWRDSRRNRGRLLLFISSIILGIAALVAINSFGENLKKDIDLQAKTLLGADMALNGNSPASDSILQWIDSVSVESASRADFPSMVLFPKGGGTRLSQISSVKGQYPFYGKLTTTPTEAQATFLDGSPKVLVDKALMVQFDASVGDSIKVGEVTFKIEGQLEAVPGRSGLTSAALPVVYIPSQFLEDTELVQRGSRVEYNYYLRIDESINPDTLGVQNRDFLRSASLRYETVASRQESVSQAFDSMNSFLNLVAFIALLLGCIGVASAVNIYIKDKISTVAVLRCLGVSGRQAFGIYLIQILALGLLGAVLGALLGIGVQQLLPIVLNEFLPLEDVSKAVSWPSVFQGVVTGVAVSLLFGMLPLIAVRNISPLRTLRASFDEAGQGVDWLRIVVIALIALFVIGFAWLQIGNWTAAFFFTLAVGVGFLILAAVAKILMWAVRRFFPVSWSYVARQSIANLYRPNNQTLILVVSIGLGTALVATLFFIQNLLLGQVALSGAGNQPNMIVFGIQANQKEGVVDLAKARNLPVIQQVPIVTIRLHSINGMTKADFLQDTLTKGRRRWVYDREYRVTYRDTLIETEKITKGEWHTEIDNPDPDLPYVSLSDRIANAMQVAPGDTLTFNVQGRLIETLVSSVREVDFSRIQTNFFVVFQSGVLEKAPQFNVLISRVNSTEESALFQKELVSKYPNVSAIDITQILKSVEEILGKVSFVIRFMAMFSILTGLLVLISSVVLSRYQRIQESVLLRTLGASRRQILMINAFEYFALGALAALTGIGLAFGASYLLAVFSFQVPFVPDFWPALWLLLAITGLTVFIGMANSREVLAKPPLEVLRKEV